MGGRSHIFLRLRAIILAIVVISTGLGGAAHCQTAGVSLLLQQIPAHGGTINPDPGVHRFKPDEEITLTAIPRPGYKFICWLGDVSNPEASSTVARINEPKVIIALFESTEYESLPAVTGVSGGGSRSGAISTAGSMSIGATNNATLMGGGGKSVKPKVVTPVTELPSWLIDQDPLLPETPDFPTSGSDDPVVPEPATGTLLILGSLFALFECRSKRQAR